MSTLTPPAPEAPTDADAIEEDPRVHPPADPREDPYGERLVARYMADGEPFPRAMARARADLDRRARRLAAVYRRCFCCSRLLPPAAMIPDADRPDGLKTRCRRCAPVVVQTLYLTAHRA